MSKEGGRLLNTSVPDTGRNKDGYQNDTVAIESIEEDGDHHHQHDDKILARLYSATRSDHDSLQREEYQDRLLSFRATTYYAKPACLSPLFCARFG
jgi:hypothetical protein